MTLRKYQQDAVDALFQFQSDRPGDSSVIVVPTGGGKTRIMAEIIRRSFSQNSDCKGMILSHVKELLEQSDKTCRHYATTTGLPVESIGVYSASMKRREIKPLTIAGIQSVYRKANDFGKLDFVMIDECHLISQNAETMYRKFLSVVRISNPNVKVVGLTATPYRLQSGIIFGSKEKTFDNCCYAIGVRDLISEGYLSPLVTFASTDSPDLKGVRIRGGEYFSKDLDAVLENKELVESGVLESIIKTKDRTSVLVFASSIKHATMILEELKNQGQKAEMVTGETHVAVRDFLIESFRRKEIKYLVNVAVLTTGFDAPGIDCVVVMRPTMSKGLWYQMVGRGFRLAENKQDCLILDFGDNALRHGCIDQIEVSGSGIELPAPKVKKCPACKLIFKIHIPICPSCGYFKPKEEKPELSQNLSKRQTEGDILSGSIPKEYEIVSTTYSVYKKTPASDPCIVEAHETLSGNLIRCYHTMKHGMEYLLWKWLKSINAPNLPQHHWHLNKQALIDADYLDTLPVPIKIKAHKNEKGYYQIDSYFFEHARNHHYF